MAINVRGVMLSYKYAATQMIKQGRGGRIIGIVHISLSLPASSISYSDLSVSSQAPVRAQESEVWSSLPYRKSFMKGYYPGSLNLSAYCASKFAVRGLTQSLCAYRAFT